MKIGILTLKFNENYGGVLQNFALQQAIRKLGHESVTINRIKWDSSRLTLKQRFLIFASWAKKAIGRHILRRDVQQLFSISGKPVKYNNASHNTYSFISKHIDLTDPVLSSEQLAGLFDSRTLNALVVGSDQVWRQAYNGCITDYFLSFETSKPIQAITYAASFGIAGHDIHPSNLVQCREGIGRFSAISVREHSAIATLSDEFGRSDATHVIDPTLLLDADDYRTVIPESLLKAPSGLVTYFLDSDDNKERITDNVSSLLTASRRTDIGFDSPINGGRLCSVEQWLAAIANASAIVTDSFHGCVFSIIFRKPFYAIVNTDRGAERFYSLLEPLGLTDRIVSSADTLPTASIDYNEVNHRLSSLRESSLEFLRKALNA